MPNSVYKDTQSLTAISFNKAKQFMPIILEFGTLRREDCYEFEIILDHRVRCLKNKHAQNPNMM